ncbi:nuclear envelope morphology protein 1 [[Candida] anglica]|uniref:Mitochondrial import inner membrane translocase subunit TIM50 n=1 Tax=[Candida] anglica TaxID=148631 RepID=A0ABP0EAI7_9ASCO
MNSLKILVNSWDALYPPVGTYDSEKEDTGSSENNLDSLFRTSIDQEKPGVTSSARNHDDEEEEQEEEEEEDPQAQPSKILQKVDSTHQSLTSYVLFVPNYLLFKPLVFTWLLLTYPFTHFFESGSKSGNSNNNNSNNNHGDSSSSSASNTSPSSDMDDETPVPPSSDEKLELFKQENMISNTIKSPSASSKYMIPPPQRLYPLSRNPNRKRKRKTLILDLDETLIHSLSRGSPRSFSSNGSSNMIEIRLNNISSLYYVYKRPYCDYFLREAAKWFELQIFTASVKEYADPIINWLESEIAPYVTANAAKNGDPAAVHGKPQVPSEQPSVFTRRYYRTDCTYRQGVGYIKDLSKFFPREDDLKNVIILDNSPVSYAMHEDNAVMIEGWINDQGDRDLVNLLPMLHSLSLCIDVRYILGLRGGEKVFEN